MKTMAYIALHYGKEWLAWAIRSVGNAVSEIHILYTRTPSFGHNTNLSCPDTEAALRAEASRFAAVPVIWHQGTWPNEGAHREAALGIARERGFDQILVLDADEIWNPDTLRDVLALAGERKARVTRVRFVHFWRSLRWLCRDPALPARILHLAGTGEWYASPQEHPVFHMGYAQTPGLVRYKEAIHGHKNEWRRGWFESKFLSWTPESSMNDVHPTCVNFWTPERADHATRELLAPILHDHPYWNLEMIP